VKKQPPKSNILQPKYSPGRPERRNAMTDVSPTASNNQFVTMQDGLLRSPASAFCQSPVADVFFPSSDWLEATYSERYISSLFHVHYAPLRVYVVADAMPFVIAGVSL